MPAIIAAFLVLLFAPQAADRPILRYVPKHEELKYTFGGSAPTHHVAPGTRIVSWSEDCYDGGLKSASQKPSAVLVPGHDNPQTGPFYVDGAGQELRRFHDELSAPAQEVLELLGVEREPYGLA